MGDPLNLFTLNFNLKTPPCNSSFIYIFGLLILTLNKLSKRAKGNPITSYLQWGFSLFKIKIIMNFDICIFKINIGYFNGLLGIVIITGNYG